MKIFTTRNIIIVLLAAIIAIYYGVFIWYGTNVPLVDDYYENLYFFHLFNHESSLIGKLHLLFWQYNDHILTLNKLCYLIQFSLIKRIDFFWISFFGSLQLILIPYLTCLLMYKNKNIDAYYIFPFFLFLSLAVWRTSYWPMATIEDLGPLTLAILICFLINKKYKTSFYLSIFCLYILAFTQGNGIVMALLTNIQILFSSRSKNEKKIWFISSMLLLLIFSLNYQMTGFVINDLSIDEKKQALVDAIPLIPVGFLMLIGSGTLFENSPIWSGLIIGTIMLVMLTWMLMDLWIVQREKFYPILVCILYSFISMIMICIGRIPPAGLISVYESHYKMYSLFLFSILSLFFAEKINNKILTVIFFASIISIPIISSIHYFPIMVKSNVDRRNEITQWTIKGTRTSLGFSGWPYLSEQILFMATREKIYSPFDTPKAALYQARHIEKISQCPLAPNIQIDSELTNIKGAVAFSISTRNIGNEFDSIYICSQSNAYHVIPNKTPTNEIVLEKIKFAPDNYSIYFASGDKIIGVNKITLTIKSESIGLNCEPIWGRVHTITLQAKNEFCKHVFK